LLLLITDGPGAKSELISLARRLTGLPVFEEEPTRVAEEELVVVAVGEKGLMAVVLRLVRKGGAGMEPWPWPLPLALLGGPWPCCMYAACCPPGPKRSNGPLGRDDRPPLECT